MTEQVQDLAFAIREPLDGQGFYSGGPAGMLVQHPAGHRLADVNAARENAADGRQYVCQRLAFHDVTFGPRAQGEFCIERLGVDAENKHRDPRILGIDVFENLQAVAILESQIQDDDVRVQVRHAPKGFLRVFCLAAHHQVGLPVNELAYPQAHQRMVIHQENPLFGCFGMRAAHQTAFLPFVKARETTTDASSCLSP